MVLLSVLLTVSRRQADLESQVWKGFTIVYRSAHSLARHKTTLLAPVSGKKVWSFLLFYQLHLFCSSLLYRLWAKMIIWHFFLPLSSFLLCALSLPTEAGKYISVTEGSMVRPCILEKRNSSYSQLMELYFSSFQQNLWCCSVFRNICLYLFS